jgi:hypothetical protein
VVKGAPQCALTEMDVSWNLFKSVLKQFTVSHRGFAEVSVGVLFHLYPVLVSNECFDS